MLYEADVPPLEVTSDGTVGNLNVPLRYEYTPAHRLQLDGLVLMYKPPPPPPYVDIETLSG